MGWWNECKEELPADAHEMHGSVHGSDIGNVSILVLSWMQHTGRNKLRVPGGLFFIFNLLQKLSEGLLLFLTLSICDYIYNLEGLLRQLGSSWGNIGELDTE